MIGRVSASWTGPFLVLIAVVLFQGCTGVNTFPTVARTGDTVSVMVGGSETARKETVAVSLTDNNGVAWDLQTLGLVRSVFNLRAAGTAHGAHYSSWLNTEISWIKGHEPVQTVLVIDVPDGAATGPATLSVNLNAGDDSSGIFQPFTITMDIIDGIGTSDQLLRQNFNGIPQAVGFEDLEAAPYAKLSFGDGSTTMGSQVLGAASLVLDFDETVVNGDDLNVYVSESSVRGTAGQTGAFGATQRMVYWRQDGANLFIDIIAPQGIEGRYLQVYVVHPRGLPGDPGLSLVSSTSYDIDGNTIIFAPSFGYSP